MPTVPKVATRERVTEVGTRRPSKVKDTTVEERAARHPRLSVYDDIIQATAGLSAEKRMAARWPAIMSDPAAWGGGEDLRQVIEEKVPGNAES